MGKGNTKKSADNTIAQNKRARFEYHLLDTFEAGVALMGWEVKALRAGRVQLTDSFVVMTKGEAFLLGAQLSPLDTVSTHYVVEKARSRKLLLHKKELAKLNQAITQQIQTCVCTSLYWKGNFVKAKISIAQGKKQHDKRDTERQRDWQRDKARIVRENVKQ